MDLYPGACGISRHSKECLEIYRNIFRTASCPTFLEISWDNWLDHKFFLSPYKAVSAQNCLKSFPRLLHLFLCLSADVKIKSISVWVHAIHAASWKDCDLQIFIVRDLCLFAWVPFWNLYSLESKLLMISWSAFLSWGNILQLASSISFWSRMQKMQDVIK